MRLDPAGALPSVPSLPAFFYVRGELMKNPFREHSKVSPQRENGHRRISTEIINAMVKTKLTGQEFRICLYVLDRTWGFNKRHVRIKVSDMAEATGIHKRVVKRNVARLEKRKILIREGSGRETRQYMFNKYYDTWDTGIGAAELNDMMSKVVENLSTGKGRSCG